jgi:hypothetical protein
MLICGDTFELPPVLAGGIKLSLVEGFSETLCIGLKPLFDLLILTSS